MKRSPASFKPLEPDELIGSASRAARALVAKARRLRSGGEGTLKVLLYGPPGVGKTTIAELVARELTGGEPCAIEDHNGREITIEVVRRWMDGLAYRGLFGGGKAARIVNELDRCSREAQDLLLTYLDRMPPDRAFLGTSNLQLDLLTERFQTRFQTWKIAAPEQEEIEAWLVRRWKSPRKLAQQISLGCGGCVRAALADLESALDLEAAK